jgi:FkbM family methyltransferase
MPGTLDQHVDYTRKEWKTKYYQDCIEYILAKSECYSFIDLGGCVGEVTNILKERIKSLKYFYIIEPVRENFDFIVKRFGSNIGAEENKEFHKIETENGEFFNVYNKAIYYGSEEITLGQLSSDTNVGGWSYSDKHNLNLIGSVKTMSLEEIPVSEIIKIDIEGLELNLLRNSQSLQECRFIFIELHGDLIGDFNFLGNYLPNHRVIYTESEQVFLELELIGDFNER